MNRFRIFYVILTIMMSGQLSGAAALIKGLKEGMTSDKVFITTLDEKKNQLKSLREQRVQLQEKITAFATSIEIRLAEIITQSNEVKAKVKREPHNEEFINSKLAALTDLYQTLKDRQQVYQQLAEFIDNHIQVLTKYVDDPNFEYFLAEYRGQRRQIYSFADLQTLRKMVRDHKTTIEHLVLQKKNAHAELESRTISANAAIKTHKKKQEELTAFVESPETKSPDQMFGFDIQQKIDLLNIQEKLLQEKAELASLRMQVTMHKLSQIKTKLLVANEQQSILGKIVERVRPLAKVSDSDIVTARTQMNKKKQQALILKGKKRRAQEVLVKENERRMQELKNLSKQYNISLDDKINDWSSEPKQTALSYLGLCRVGALNSQHLLVERRRELLGSQISLEDEKIRAEELQLEIKISFQGIAAERFIAEDDRNKEIKKYNEPQVEINATISRFKERENAVTDLLSIQKRARDNLKLLLEDIQKKRATVFKNDPNRFNQCMNLLHNAWKLVQDQINNIEKMVGVYHDIIATAQGASRQISFIIGELRAIGIWHRPKGAITMKDIKRVLPDLKRFFGDIRSYIVGFSFSNLFAKTKTAFPQTADLLWLLFKIIIVLMSLVFFKWYVHTRLYKLFTHLHEHRGLRAFSLLAHCILDFINYYYVMIAVWIGLFALIQFGVLPDYGVQILFYFFSIPYFLYLANRFLARFVLFNARKKYAILSEQFQPRFMLIISTLLYATITILLFKQAFVLSNYQESRLPANLLVLNFIILQVCLIFLITKEQILNLIPTATEAWRRVHAQVNRFFYLILAFIVAIIIMSNPYVGFGRLVLHILYRLLFTLLLVPVIFWVQLLFKKIASRLFFSIDHEVVKERFSSAKSWYGLFVIVMFLSLMLIGFVAGAHIWGWPITFKEIFDLIRAPIFFGESPVPGAPGVPISAITFLYLIGYVLAGFLLAFAVNRFVLRKIFDLLLVEMGIQHAVVGLMRYLIIIIVIVIGLQNIGLGPLSKYLFGAVLAITWVIKEPLGDLVAYFVLLIQRPIKIGDYIKIDEQISGVVRRITPRSIVIRQKNSTTIVVPNSQVLSKAVTNWNYVSGFVAVDDVLVNILYKEDPDRVIEVLRVAVDAHANVLKSPKPVVRLEKFGEHSFIFLVRAYVSSHYTLDKWNIASDIRLSIIRELRSNGIAIAVPVRIMISPNNQQGIVQEKLKE